MIIPSHVSCGDVFSKNSCATSTATYYYVSLITVNSISMLYVKRNLHYQGIDTYVYHSLP